MKKKIKWLGMVPVRIRGYTGHIQPKQVIEVDETIADNLLRDEFWELVQEVSTPPTNLDDKLSESSMNDTTEVPGVVEPTQERKKKKQKGGQYE